MPGSCRNMRERFQAMRHGKPRNQTSDNAHSDVDFCHTESNFPEVRDLKYPFPVYASVSSVSSVRRTDPGRGQLCADGRFTRRSGHW